MNSGRNNSGIAETRIFIAMMAFIFHVALKSYVSDWVVIFTAFCCYKLNIPHSCKQVQVKLINRSNRDCSTLMPTLFIWKTPHASCYHQMAVISEES
jgi:hypothetical protein